MTHAGHEARVADVGGENSSGCGTGSCVVVLLPTLEPGHGPVPERSPGLAYVLELELVTHAFVLACAAEPAGCGGELLTEETCGVAAVGGAALAAAGARSWAHLRGRCADRDQGLRRHRLPHRADR